MAILIDPVHTDEEKKENDDVLASLEAEQPSTEEASPNEVTDETPAKYTGKSAADIIRMHQEAEKQMGRQSQEVGELRKIVDDFIQNQTASSAPQEEEVDFFDDPKAAVNDAVENHPAVQAAKKAGEQLTQQQALVALQSKHPDIGDIMRSQAFGEWVSGSPYRMRMYESADKNYDYEAADELLTLYKDQQNINTQQVEAEKASRKAAVREASTGGTRGSGERRSKKIYRRRDIMDLMKNDPARYEALQPEIMQAYKDKRVK